MLIPKILDPSLNLNCLSSFEPINSNKSFFIFAFNESKFSFILSGFEVPGIGTTPIFICQLRIICPIVNFGYFFLIWLTTQSLNKSKFLLKASSLSTYSPLTNGLYANNTICFLSQNSFKSFW